MYVCMYMYFIQPGSFDGTNTYRRGPLTLSGGHAPHGFLSPPSCCHHFYVLVHVLLFLSPQLLCKPAVKAMLPYL